MSRSFPRSFPHSSPHSSPRSSQHPVITPKPSPALCHASHPPILSLGDRGQAVQMLRQLLSDSTKIRTGSSRVISGDRFTPVVEQLVKQFQQQTFLDADGIVGIETWRTLCADSPVHMATLEWGDRSVEVRQLQQRLFQLDAYLGNFDGYFGPTTFTAVRTFQGDRGLIMDGIVGHRTWDALSRPHAPSRRHF